MMDQVMLWRALKIGAFFGLVVGTFILPGTGKTAEFYCDVFGRTFCFDMDNFGASKFEANVGPDFIIYTVVGGFGTVQIYEGSHPEISGPLDFFEVGNFRGESYLYAERNDGKNVFLKTVTDGYEYYLHFYGGSAPFSKISTRLKLCAYTDKNRECKSYHQILDQKIVR